MASDDRLRELEDKYEDYTVYDNSGSKIGKVDDLFVDEADQEEYIGVKMGLFGSKSTLIPTEIVQVNEADRRIEVSDSKDHVKDAPTFSDDDEITPDYEERIRGHFGLQGQPSPSGRGSYGGYSGDEDASTSGSTSGAAAGTAAGSTSGGGGMPDDSGHRGTEGSTGGSSGSGPESFGEGETREIPTTRQTEETETYQEGGRTKVRRRIIREEIIEEDVD